MRIILQAKPRKKTTKQGDSKMEKSTDLYSQLLESDPSQKTVLVIKKMKDEGHLKEAVDECLKAINRYPTDIRLKNLLAETYYAMGSVDMAEAELEKATMEISQYVEAYKLLAQIRAQKNKNQLAYDALTKYLVHYPDDKEARDLFNHVNPSPEEAPEETSVSVETDQSTEVFPEEASSELATSTLAEIYFDQGQIHEAIATYEKVIAKDPEDDVSKSRLKELQSMISGDKDHVASGNETLVIKQEKMISILERWLVNLRLLQHAEGGTPTT